MGIKLIMEAFLILFCFTPLVSFSFVLENKGDISDLQRQIDFLMEARQADHEEIEKLKEYVVDPNTNATFHRQRQRRQTYPGVGVGFTACIGERDRVLSERETLIFDRVITNEDDAYNATTGIFTAPYDGIYVFHFSVMTEAGKHLYVQIVRDGTVIDDVLTDGSNDQSWESASEMWVLKLNSGNQVWMRSTVAGDVHGFCHTMFSGFFI